MALLGDVRGGVALLDDLKDGRHSLEMLERCCDTPWRLWHFLEVGRQSLGSWKMVEEKRGKDFRIRVSLTLIPCREIENPKKIN